MLYAECPPLGVNISCSVEVAGNRAAADQPEDDVLEPSVWS